MPQPVRVLYVGGTGRTGSTLLDSLLGAFPGVFSAGELTFLWKHGLRNGGRCSCGTPIRDCEIWTAALVHAFGDVDAVDPQRMVELRERFWSVHLPLMVAPIARRRGMRRLEEFPATVERLYRSLAETTGSRLIVDSSKEPHYSYILREGTNLEVYFLHLVRDPRAVGRSWMRRRSEAGYDGRIDMEKRGSSRTAVYYDISNVASEMIWRGSSRYAFMRYEDFVIRPHESLRAIGDFVGIDLDVDSVLDDSGSFERVGTHSAWGNPNRFERGRTELRPDDAWKKQLSGINRVALSTMTLPLMRRYGYPVLSQQPVGPRGRPGTTRIPSEAP